VENAPVCVAVEVVGVDDFRREIEGVVVEQNRTEHRPLGFEVVRQRALGDSDVRHPAGAGWTNRECSSRTGVDRHALVFSTASATTRTFTVAVTSRCSLIGTSYSPSFLIGSCSSILRPSWSNPQACSPSA